LISDDGVEYAGEDVTDEGIVTNNCKLSALNNLKKINK